MNKINRRDFIKQSLIGGASISLWPVVDRGQTNPSTTPPGKVQLRVRGANDDIRAAVIGFNGQGRVHIRSLRNLKGVRVVALCDVDKDVLDRETKAIKDNGESVDASSSSRRQSCFSIPFWRSTKTLCLTSTGAVTTRPTG